MIKVFCDFDGTVTLGDVGDAFFRHFCTISVDEQVKRWERGEINSRDLYLLALQHFRATPEEVESFVASQRLEPTFPELAGFCQREKIPLVILSDGMDIYIRPILERNGLDGLTVYSNVMRWHPEKGWEMEFPYVAHACVRCANCKGYHLRRLRKPGDRLVFVGDGFSDLCAVREADVVFAKAELEEFCKKQGLEFIPWRDFRDVVAWLRRALKREWLTRTGLKY